LSSSRHEAERSQQLPAAFLSSTRESLDGGVSFRQSELLHALGEALVAEKTNIECRLLEEIPSFQVADNISHNSGAKRKASRRVSCRLSPD
jgi:hypothetical protein